MVGPWVVLGDFNTVFSQAKKFGRHAVASHSSNGLSQLILQHELIDLGFVGLQCTWCNSRAGSRRIKEPLDKGSRNAN